MNVTEAVHSRRSIRQFLDKPVDRATLEQVLETAQRSPSGDNTQPWNAIVVGGDALKEITAKIKDKAKAAPMGENMEYAIYPKDLDGRYELFTYTRKYMGPPQWSDMGMWLQTVMLLLREAGLDSCPQEIWAMYGSYMRELLGIDDDHIFFCGMAIGHRDPDAPINKFDVPRVPIREAIEFRGL